MGKKSLIKSTSKKKKTTSKKKDTDKKSKPEKKTVTKQTSASQKAPAKKKAPAKEKVSEKKMSLKDLIFRKFEKQFAETVSAAETEKRTYSAPPIITASDDKEAARIKALLFKKFDLTSPPEKPRKVAEAKEPVEKQRVKKPSPEKKTPEKADYKETAEEKKEPPVKEKPAETPIEEKEPKKVDYKEIMARKFHKPLPDEMLVKVPERLEKKDYTAPPLISMEDEKEAARIKELLFKQFEIPPSSREPAVPELEKPEAAPIEEETPKTEIPVEASERPELQTEAVKDQKIVPETDKIEKEKTEKEDKGPGMTVSYDEPPPTDTEVSDPMDKILKIVAAGVALIFLLIIGVSFNNQSKYYIKPVEDGIEVWKGRFAPMGEDILAKLEGVTPPENIKDVYEAQEVLPMIVSYHVERADTLLHVNVVPDLRAIKENLDKAQLFASSREDHLLIRSRLNLLEAAVLQYRANVAASRDTPEDLSLAIGFLSDSLRLDIDEQQKSLIQDRIDFFQQQRNGLLAPEETGVDEQLMEDKSAENEVVEIKESENVEG
jgi:hypothetical protein